MCPHMIKIAVWHCSPIWRVAAATRRRCYTWYGVLFEITTMHCAELFQFVINEITAVYENVAISNIYSQRRRE